MDKTLELIQKAQAGDKSALDQIVEENVGLVWSVVKKFIGRGHDSDDLFQIGAIGLIKCVKKFDLSYDVKFSTYAVPMIIGEIKRFLRDDGLIKVSRQLKEVSVKAKYKNQELIQKMGKQPTVSELAAALNIENEELTMALEAGKEVESLYSTVYQGDGSPVLLIDKLDQEAAESASIVDVLAVRELIKKLEPKERQIIMLRYFSDKTQSEIAKEVGVSQVQVSRLEKKILQNMRSSL